MLEVVISPSSSCYFAGEQFQAKVTFTNTNSPATARQQHRRGAHSISSAPLARPPTSPGVLSKHFPGNSPKTPTNPVQITHPHPQRRRGVIGKGQTHLISISEPGTNHKGSSKALSLSLSPSEVSHSFTSRPELDQPASIPLGRIRAVSAEIPFPANHPHARKESFQFNESQQTNEPNPFPLKLGTINELSSSPIASPLTPSPALYTRSPLSGEPISHPAIKSETNFRGLGIGMQSTAKSRSVSTTQQGSETLLWAYAQLSGTVEIDPGSVKEGSIAALRSKLTRSVPIGGGRMDLHDQTPSNSSNDASWGGIFGFSLPSSKQPSPVSFLSNLLRSSSLRPSEQDKPDSNSLNTFNPPQAMLAVDLNLSPGESKTYTYTMQLPEALPPTFRGRAFRFSYHFVVGTCRGRIAGHDAQSRLLRIPLRVYNYVSLNKPITTYDLLLPIIRGSGSKATVEDLNDSINKPIKSVGPVTLKEVGLSQIQQFGGDLIQGRSVVFQEDADTEMNKTSDCRFAVEVLTRQARKAVYDVQKGTSPVAKLVLPKATFRLGETVHGTVSMNCFEGGLAVFQMSALLETHERIPNFLQTGVKSTGLRRVHAEQHCSLSVDIERMAFALDIPSDASPGFGLTVDGEATGSGGLEWRIRICFLVGTVEGLMEETGAEGEWGTGWSASEGSGSRETVECEVGIVVLPAHTVFGTIPVTFSA